MSEDRNKRRLEGPERAWDRQEPAGDRRGGQADLKDPAKVGDRSRAPKVRVVRMGAGVQGGRRPKGTQMRAGKERRPGGRGSELT